MVIKIATDDGLTFIEIDATYEIITQSNLPVPYLRIITCSLIKLELGRVYTVAFEDRETVNARFFMIVVFSENEIYLNFKLE